ncbi:tetratricopeptide repeat protein [Aestuariibaculum sediminum]|uniref:Tetratricopeptide repeat protein n=1 Tax=Aestuariibaculum sediminum TaxID=2770637 RepID=A0A8J6U6A0_9FLAO|nr:tetratricopeptide repeat protein [Aestuariibaculum sediminum]MBD0830640.1 tetratricopeptide repeat protein [Aestuariibaculum sediminum]
MLYYLTFALQAYCIYHMYKNGNPYYWVFVILFLPLVGSIIYLITQVYNKRDAEKIQDGIVAIINPTKKIKDLEKRLRFSETYQNRVNLADAYMENKDYANAIFHYLEAVKDKSQNHFYIIKKLIEAYYTIEDYDNVLVYAKMIKDNPEFEKSKAQFLYGLAQDKLGDFEAAETNLKQINIRYSFYEERLQLAKILLERQKTNEAKEILDDVVNEYENMTKPNKKLYRNSMQEAHRILSDMKD